MDASHDSFGQAGAAAELTTAQQRFINVFRHVGNVLRTSRACKMARTTHYEWMKQERYRAAFLEAERDSATILEDEAWRRAVDGWDKPVFQGGRKVGVIREYDSGLLQTLLRARKPETYRDRSSVEVTGKDGKPLIPLATVDAILAEAQAERQRNSRE